MQLMRASSCCTTACRLCERDSDVMQQEEEEREDFSPHLDTGTRSSREEQYSLSPRDDPCDRVAGGPSPPADIKVHSRETDWQRRFTGGTDARVQGSGVSANARISEPAQTGITTITFTAITRTTTAAAAAESCITVIFKVRCI